MAVSVDEVLALRHVHLFVGHFYSAASDRGVFGRVACVEIVPGIVGNVVRATGLVHAQEVYRARAIGQGDAEIGAVWRGRPVGDAVGVDFAPEDTNRGRVAVVGCDPGSAGRWEAFGLGSDREEGERCE